jgi:hypothetical protein
MAGYFTLETSDVQISKRFRVIYGGYAHVLEKAQTVDRTVEGIPDIQVGSIQEKYSFAVRVRETEEDYDYGTEEDLRDFFSLNNPLSTPSNHITMIDHFGDEKTVVMLGDYSAQVQGIMIVGTEAWYIVNCSFLVIPD